jgi:Fe-S oxidoreductase
MMCPTFVATGDEVMSTRGRANIIRAALQLRVNGHDPLISEELDAALSNCLACKGCTPECPSNVNLALLKAEMTYARHRRDGLPLREKIFSNLDRLGKIGCAMPSLINAVVDLAPIKKALGISARRSVPHYAHERFDRWFAKRNGAHRAPLQKKVILWDDTFVRYHEPQIGIAAVKVLQALGFEVALAQDRHCCGRPAFSQGNLDFATKLGKHNVDLLNGDGSTPIVFLEPSCWSMFVEDYPELKIANAEKLGARCFLFEQFVNDALERQELPLQNRPQAVAIHAHCHAKSIIQPQFMARLAERLPGRKATVLDTGCCGMAGAFGMLAEKYDLSVQVARDLIDKIETAQPDVVVASGTSCRHQLVDLTGRHALHMAELIANAIA